MSKNYNYHNPFMKEDKDETETKIIFGYADDSAVSGGKEQRYV